MKKKCIQDNFKLIKKKLTDKSAIIGIIGAGYVGSSFGKVTAKSGYRTLAFDIEKSKLEEIKALKIPLLCGENDIAKLQVCDIIVICVGTPINDKKKPDLNAVKLSIENIAKYLRSGQLIILESTVAPGMTRRIVASKFKKNNLILGIDYFLGYSPERVDFGNSLYNIKNTPKVVAGVDEKSLDLIAFFYGRFVDQIVKMSSLEAAELCKIWENTFRFVNINLVNQLHEYALSIGVDIWEVIDAAATKPYGFFPFYPGPGISGHCIPVDPYYLLDDAKRHQFDFSILKIAMGFHKKRINKIVSKIFDICKKNNAPHILIQGIAFKKEINDIRESVGVKIYKILKKREAKVIFNDPYVSKLGKDKSTKLSVNLLKNLDLIVIITDHDNVDYEMIYKSGKPILDLKNVFKNKRENIYKI
jgi:UDP-N-acetyl-D-glucosamine dehydrogenase